MDYISVISNSFEYTKNALVGKWMDWLILAVLALVQTLTLSLIPLLSGYVVRVISGKTPAPMVDEWGKLFIDGWKLNIIGFVYMIPALLVFLVLGGLGAIGMLASEAAGGDGCRSAEPYRRCPSCGPGRARHVVHCPVCHNALCAQGQLR